MPLDSNGSFVGAANIAASGVHGLIFTYSGDANYSPVVPGTQLTVTTSPLTTELLSEHDLKRRFNLMQRAGSWRNHWHYQRVP